MLESLIAIVILAVLLASWTLWSGTFLRLWMKRPLLPVEPRRPAPWGIIELGVALALFIVLPMAALTVLRKTTNLLPSAKLEELSSDGRAVVLLIGSLASLAVLGITLALARTRVRASWQDLGVSLRKTPLDVAIGLAAFLMLAPLVYLIMLVLVQWFTSEHPLIKLVKENPDPRFFALSCFSAVIVAPLVEEFVFRVLLQGWLEALGARLQQPVVPVLVPPVLDPLEQLPLVDAANPYAPPIVAPPPDVVTAQIVDTIPPPAFQSPPVWPMFVSAAIFAALHLGHGPDPIPLFVLALGLGYLYRQTHRVLPGIVVHMLLNATSMLLLLLNVYGGLK